MLKPTVLALVIVGAASGTVLGQDPGIASRIQAFQQDATRDDAAGLIRPIGLQSPLPHYTPEAMRLKVQGSVDVQIVVGVDGSVVRTRVVKVAWSGEGDAATPFTEATPGLLENAITAAKASKFKPGTLNGTPVPVMTTITLTFRIH